MTMDHGYTYYFNQDKLEKQFYSILNSTLFHQIINYFIENQHKRIILREIKKEISTDDNIEFFLDKMIQYKLISRFNRHYSLSFPIYDLADYSLDFDKNLMNSLDSIKEKNKDEQLIGFVGETLWQACETDEDYFFGVKRNMAPVPFYEKKIVGDTDLKMVAIQQEHAKVLNIPTYFNLLRLNTLPKQYDQLEQLLGDVNQDYFFSQVKKILKKGQKNRISSSKRDIFEEALLLTDDLFINDGKLYLTSPIIKGLILKTDNQNIKQIIEELIHLWRNYDSVNEQTFIKKISYLKLMEYFFGKERVLSYFLI